MEINKYSIGLDVDKASIKACFKASSSNGHSAVKSTATFTNNLKGFRDIDLWIKKHRKMAVADEKIVMEATGVYHEHLAWNLRKAGYKIYILLPLRSKRYM